MDGPPSLSKYYIPIERLKKTLRSYGCYGATADVLQGSPRASCVTAPHEVFSGGFGGSVMFGIEGSKAIFYITILLHYYFNFKDIFGIHIHE